MTVRSFRVLQNNKALKHGIKVTRDNLGFRVLQNNKALKPQMRLKNAYCRTVILIDTPIISRSAVIFNYFT